MSMSLVGNNFFNKRRTIEFAAVGIIGVLMVVVLPLLNSLNLMSNFWLGVIGKYLCYAILAISVDMLWGYMGLLSLGQALFFSLGGYMLGMYLMRMIGGETMPTFLNMQGYTDWPWFFGPFTSFPFAMLMVLIVPGIVALVFGFLAFRSRIKGVYFSILTQALTYAAALQFFRNDMLMGGNNGFTDFKFILGHDIRSADTQRILYIITGVVLIGIYGMCRWLNGTKFGLVQRAIRDSENRVLFSGYAAAHYKLFIFVLSAVVAAIGGALYVAQVQIINPAEMQVDKSLDAVVWVAVGGRGTLLGPIIGAISVNALKSWATNVFPDAWLIILGGLFVLVVLFMPKGIVGLPAQLMGVWKRYQAKRPAADETPVSLPETSTTESSASSPAK
ncbi:amino acid/amide ABC transporter membrane protein 2 (HAAT family) [Roseimicrobium gellanilyticum]|uniref:Amino acid/amide ABC transporter membrane protein 2 (HAAT family) n=1 Tax=Roseimicrobium gellanilyticum TaxID=748857 RepID=A0A366HWU6_9BACT|nr:urea ABC transporter permease subunit UrtC [Roseimicrobium gellanilyticum]RBP47955.1 amino acid/amide ABC transporter membrane protein 2 (HAAT family) [Roseimicrobium gellanilyticum]